MNARCGVLALALCLAVGCTGTSDNTSTPWTGRQIDDGTSTTPVALRVVDMNDDDLLDVVSVWRGSAASGTRAAVPPRLRIDFQQTPTAWNAVVIDSGSRYAEANAVAVADVDKDNHVDVVVAAMDRIIYLRAPANPTNASGWTPYDIEASIGTDFKAWFDVAVGQIDGTGGLDIVAALGPTGSGRVSWFKAPTNPNAATGWEITNIDTNRRDGADSVELIDLDGDGRLDVVSSAPGEATDVLSWYKQPDNPTSGTWTRNAMSNLAGATRFAIADLDGDNDADMAAVAPKENDLVAAWMIRPATVTSRWSGWQIIEYTGTADGRIPTDIAIIDVEKDGQNDVIVSTSDPAQIVRYTPRTDRTQWWVETRLASYSSAIPTLFDTGDIDGDGYVDIVVPIDDDNNSDDRIEWLKNPGTQPAS